MRALTAGRQAAPMTQAAIAPEIHEPLDIHTYIAAKVTFHLV
jgi:hypothetical protein